jgi:hypothetical protein
MSEDHESTRVNSARLKDFVGASHPVRMTGKVLNVRPPKNTPILSLAHRTAFFFSHLCLVSQFSNDETYFLMEAPDGGQIKVLLPPVRPSAASESAFPRLAH